MHTLIRSLVILFSLYGNEGGNCRGIDSIYSSSIADSLATIPITVSLLKFTISTVRYAIPATTTANTIYLSTIRFSTGSPVSTSYFNASTSTRRLKNLAEKDSKDEVNYILDEYASSKNTDKNIQLLEGRLRLSKLVCIDHKDDCNEDIDKVL